MPLAALLLPFVLKKELAEFAWISYVLFSSLALFTLVNIIELTLDPKFTPEGIDKSILAPKYAWETVSALSVTMLAYSYQQNCLPIYSELRNKTNAEYDKVSLTGLPMTGLIYLCVGTICSMMFGQNL